MCTGKGTGKGFIPVMKPRHELQTLKTSNGNTFLLSFDAYARVYARFCIGPRQVFVSILEDIDWACLLRGCRLGAHNTGL